MNGRIVKFLMQSGVEKGQFTLDTSSPIGETLHTGEITGLGLDSLNKFLVSSFPFIRMTSCPSQVVYRDLWFVDDEEVPQVLDQRL